MKTEEQSLAIAKACGWHLTKDEKDFIFKRNTRGGYDSPPDYLNDLNAMHEVEKTLNTAKLGFYNAQLSLIAVKRNLSSVVKEPHWIFELIHATAAQRTEAFLRTLNLWKE